MDLPPLNVNKFQASVDIIRYCEWPKIKKYMNKRIVKAVNECKTQATIINKKSKKFVDQIEKKKWSLKKRSSSKGELEEKYDLDEDEISWGSDFDDEDDLDEDDVANNEFHIDENRFNQQRLNDCRAGHYDLSQLNNNLTNGEQLMNVGRFERISTPTNSLILDNNDLVNYGHRHHSNSITANNNLDVNNLDINNDVGCTNSMCSSNCGNSSTPVSSSGVSSVCGTSSCGTESNGSDNNSPSVSSYASACSSNSSCNSSAADSTCSQSPIPLSTPNSSINNHTSSSAKLACKLLAKLLSNGQLENEHLSSTNLQLKLQLNEQLNKQFSEIRLNMNSQSNERSNQQNHINRINDHQISNQINEHFKQTLNHSLSSKLNQINENKSNSMNVINNNYLKNLDFKSNLTNKSMINLSQYNQLNDYQFKLNENNLNDDIITVKTTNHQNYQKYKFNNSTSNLSTFKSNSVSNNSTKSIVARQIEQLNSKLNSQPNSQSSSPIQDSNDNESSGLSSGSSSILSTFKYNSNNSDKSYQTAKESSGSSCSSSIRSISLKQLSINKPTVPPKPNIVLKEDKNRTKKIVNSKLSVRPSGQPPQPPSKKQNSIPKEIDKDEIKNQITSNNQIQSPIIAKKQDKSPYSSSHSINDLISEFTIAEVEEILANCKLSDDDENDNSFTKKLLQQQFSKSKSLQHLNVELEKNECMSIENGLKLKAENLNKQTEKLSKNEIELNEKLQVTKKDLINNLNKLDENTENNHIVVEERKSRFDYKFKNHEFDSKLDAECLTSDAILNLRKTGNLKTKLGIDKELDDYEKPICNLKNREENENYYLNKEAVDQLIENRISPPPEFRSSNDDDKNLIKTNKFNDELKSQLKKQISLNKHLQSRWSTLDLQSHNLNNNLINTPLPPPIPFNSSPNSNNNSSKQYSSSMLALQNRPKLPKNKFDFLYSTNRLTTAKKLPGKLKSLPEIFSSKISGSNQKLSLTNKLIDEKLNNTFSSTNLVNQINQNKYQQNLTNQLAVRPLPPLPLEHYSWFHNLEREDATNLLIKFGVDGGYLVRTSKRAGLCNPYSLSIYHNNKCFNLNIRKRSDGLYALGKEKDKEKTFQSISQLIEYHQTESILLTTKGQNAGCCKLVATPNKF